MKGKIVLIHFPFTDMSALKLRPALVIHESDQDVVVAFISSRIPETPVGFRYSHIFRSPFILRIRAQKNIGDKIR